MALVDEELVVRPLGAPGDLGWVVGAHGELYAREFGGDTTFESLVVEVVAAYTKGSEPERQAAWIAELNGERVGCIFVVPYDADTAQLRLLLVSPSARGRRLGQRLLDEALTFATESGFRSMRLWTNHPLEAARHLYLAAGFELVQEEPHHSFGVDLVGQTYVRALRIAS